WNRRAMRSAAASSLFSTWSSTGCLHFRSWSRRPSPTTSARPRCWAAWACSCWAAASGSSPAGCTLLSDEQDRQNHHDEDESTDADRPDDRPEQREVASQQVACDTNDRRPRQAADRAEQLESPERHPGHPREHRTPRPQPEDKAGGEDRLVAMAGEEQLCPSELLRADVQEVAEALDEGPASAVTQPVAQVRPSGRADKAEEDDQDQRVVAGRGPCGGGEEQGLARKRNARALDEDAQPGRRVAEHVDDPSPVHWPSYTGRPHGRI